MATTPAADDRQWIRAAVGQFERPLTLYATRLPGDVERARDCVQDAFLRLCAQREADLRGRVAEWLFTVCRNRALDVLRKEARMTRLSDEQLQVRTAPDPPPPELIERRDSAAKV